MGVGEMGIVVGYEVVHEALKVVPGGRIGVLHEDEAATRVADEYGGEPVHHAGFP